MCCLGCTTRCIHLFVLTHNHFVLHLLGIWDCYPYSTFHITSTLYTHSPFSFARRFLPHFSSAVCAHWHHFQRQRNAQCASIKIYSNLHLRSFVSLSLECESASTFCQIFDVEQYLFTRNGKKFSGYMINNAFTLHTSHIDSTNLVLVVDKCRNIQR